MKHVITALRNGRFSKFNLESASVVGNGYCIVPRGGRYVRGASLLSPIRFILGISVCNLRMSKLYLNRSRCSVRNRCGSSRFGRALQCPLGKQRNMTGKPVTIGNFSAVYSEIPTVEPRVRRALSRRSKRNHVGGIPCRQVCSTLASSHKEQIIDVVINARTRCACFRLCSAYATVGAYVQMVFNSAVVL